MKRAQLSHGTCQTGMAALKSGTVDLILADPPYNIGVDGAAWDKLKDYMTFAKSWLTESVRILRDGGALLIYGSPCEAWMARMTVLLIDELGMQLVQDMPWVYRQGGDARWETMRQYAVRHERLVWFEKPPTMDGARVFNAQAAAEHYSEEERTVALAKGRGRVTAESLDKGRPPRTFIDIPRENSRSRERQYGKHPSMKPLPLCERIIEVHSNVNDTVVIPFAGSGSELLTACKLGRNAIGFETEAGYIQLMTRRFASHGAPLQFSDDAQGRA